MDKQLKFYAVDIGNTYTKIAFVSGRKVLKLLVQNSSDRRIKLSSDFSNVAIVSTVKKRHYSFRKGTKVLYAEDEVKVPLKTSYDRRSIGVDRLLNVYFVASAFKSKQSIVLNMGSAVTIDVVSSEGIHKGGVILAGEELALRSLNDYCDMLPLVRFMKSDKLTQLRTEDAIAAGTYLIYKSLLEYINRSYRDYLIVGSGGFAGYYRNYFDKYVSNITLKGLIELYNYHCERVFLPVKQA